VIGDDSRWIAAKFEGDGDRSAHHLAGLKFEEFKTSTRSRDINDTAVSPTHLLTSGEQIPCIPIGRLTRGDTSEVPHHP
jgi:hypothetical protein